jgi:hypothetical protein
MAVSSDKDVSTQFPFLGISNDKTLVDHLSSDEGMCMTEQSSEAPEDHNAATCSVKSYEQVGNILGTVELADQVDNTLGTLMASNVMDKILCTMKPDGQLGDDNFGSEKLVEQVDNSTGALKTNEKIGNSLFTVRPDEGVGDILCTVKLVEQVDDSATMKAKEHVDDSLCIMKTEDRVDNSLGTMKLVECVDNTSGAVELDEWIHNSLSSQNFDEQTNSCLRAVKPNGGDDNSLSTMKPVECIFNDLNTMTPDNQVDKSFSSLKSDEVSCSLQHVVRPLESTLKQPEQVENNLKEVPRLTWKVSWAATGNPQPVANSNTSALQATGPLGNATDGESVLLSSSPHRSFELLQKAVPSHTAIQEVKTSVKQNAGMLREEGRISNCDNPIPDILNNNNKIKEGAVIDSSDETRLRLECKEESGYNTRLCEDENYNVPKLNETVFEGDSNKSVSETVSCRSFEVETTTGVNEMCDSKCNIGLNDSQDGNVLEEDDTGTCPESSKLAGSSDIVGSTSECTAEGSDTELNIESNATKNSPTNGVNIKPIACWKWDSDQFGVGFGDGSAANGRLSSDKSWSRNCDSSLVSVKSAATTVLLMGSSSEFSSCEMDAHRGPGAGSLLLQDHSGRYNKMH